MRVSKREMQASHERIVTGASRLFRERGLQSTSVADAMRAAGLTHGGFYRHFDDKDELVAAALRAAFDGVLAPLEAMTDDAPGKAVDRVRAFYLSDAHVADAANGCAMPALGGEVARGSPALKAEFGAAFTRFVDALSRAMEGSPKDRRAHAVREFAMLAGAVMIARASDPETARTVLAACRSGPKRERVPSAGRAGLPPASESRSRDPSAHA